MSEVIPAAPAAPAPNAAPEAPVNAAPTEEFMDDLSEELGEPQEPEKKVETPASLKKKLKIKVDGEEIEEEYDPNDEEYLRKNLQKSKAFDKRAKEFATLQSQVDQLVEMLKTQPDVVLERLGLNVDEFAEKRINRKIEDLKKPPEQIEREKMQLELEELKAEKKRIQEEKEKAEMERLRNEHASQINEEILSALNDAKSILPKKNPLVLQRIAQTMVMAMKNGYPNVTAKEVIPIVEKQWKKEMNEFFAESPEDLIEMLVGKEPLTKYRKSLYSRNKSSKQALSKPASPVDSGESSPSQAENQDNKKPFKSFFKLNE